MNDTNQKPTHVIACADAWLRDAGQPTYSDLLAKLERSMTTTHTQPAGCDLDSLTRYDLFETDDGDELRVEPDGRWVRFDDVREALTRAAQAPQGDTRQGAPSDYVLMPKRLTAENGAKAALSGEFKESVEVTCPTCDGSGDDPDFDGDPTEHGSACLECNGDGTVAQNVPVSWDTIKDIYKAAVALLATPAAHTCTPADERAQIEAAAKAIYRLFDGAEDHAWRNGGNSNKQDEARRYARAALAAQGAGTAPDHSALIRHLRNMASGSSGASAQLMRQAADALATHPAPVSTAAAPVATSPAVDAPEGWMLVPIKPTSPMWKAGAEKVQGNDNPYQVYSAMLGAAPTATVSTAAATTASASEQDAQYEVIVDRRDLFDFLRAAWREGSSVGWVDTAESWHKATDYAEEVIKGWNTMYAPSRAADVQQGANQMTERKAKEIGEREGMTLAGYVLQSDDGRACIIHQGAVRWLSNEELWSIVHPADGQQGASRAVLDVLDDLDTYDPERDMPGVMEFRDKYHDGGYYKVEDVRAALTRAPLPAQAVDDVRDAARLNLIEEIIAERGYCYLHNNRAREPLGLDVRPGELRTALDSLMERRAAQSRAQSDTTGDRK